MKHPSPAGKLSPLARLLAEQRTLVIGVGAGLGVILLLALIVWMFFGRRGIAEAMRYLPNDCVIVGTVNVDEVMNSSIYQQIKKDLSNFDAGERNMEQEIGIAPSNISRITFAAAEEAQVWVIRLKKAVSATDIKSNMKISAYKKNLRYEEAKIGSITAFEETYRFSFNNDKADRVHGRAFCLPESTLIVACLNLEVMKKILERGNLPELSEGMQNALSETNFSKTMAVAVNVKGLMASEDFARDVKQRIGNNSELKGLEGLDEQFMQNLLGLAVDASLDSSKATVNATLLCKDAKFAEDAKKILEGGQVIMRNTLKGMHGAPRELSDVVDGVKFSVSGAKVKGNVPASLEPLSKWIKEQADKADQWEDRPAKKAAGINPVWHKICAFHQTPQRWYCAG